MDILVVNVIGVGVLFKLLKNDEIKKAEDNRGGKFLVNPQNKLNFIKLGSFRPTSTTSEHGEVLYRDKQNNLMWVNPLTATAFESY